MEIGKAVELFRLSALRSSLDISFDHNRAILIFHRDVAYQLSAVYLVIQVRFVKNSPFTSTLKTSVESVPIRVQS